MSDIKLKAWVKNEELVATVEVLDIAHRKAYLRFSEEMQGLDGYFYLGDIELLPCSNLKDKNGKDICTGDYIKMHYFFDGINPITLGVEEMEFTVKGFVCCDLDGFYVVDDGDKFPLSLMQDSEAESEILGNIYESHELRKERNG